MGISVRRFDGWEPAEVHEHEYNDDGRLVRTVVTREPEWDDDERSWMLGLAEREADQCRSCGQDLNETLDPNLRWAPQPPLVCFSCVGLNLSRESYKDHPDHAAMLHTVKKSVRPKPKRKPKAG